MGRFMEKLLKQNKVQKPRVEKQDSVRFTRLLIEYQVKNIHQTLDNFAGDHHLAKIRRSINEIEKLLKTLE